MPKKILIPQRITQPGLNYLKERGYEIVIDTGTSIEELKQAIVDCDAMLVRTAPIPAEVLEAGVKLQVIAKHGVGVDNIDMETATRLGIQVTSAPESNANTVAEHTLALILALAKRLLPADQRFRKGDFDIRNRLGSIDLEGKVLGLIGVGRIGSLVAPKAAAFGMNIAFYDPYTTKPPSVLACQRCDSMGQLLAISDFVSLHLPLTAHTRQMIGKAELEQMRPTAYIINVSRGEIIHESDLIDALRNGKLAGAALDVFEKEPPDTENPLFGMEQVIVTPHAAAMTREAADRMGLHAAMGIDDVLQGREPVWPVNRVPAKNSKNGVE